MIRLIKIMAVLAITMLIAMPAGATSYMYVSDSDYDWSHTGGVFRWKYDSTTPLAGIPAPGVGFTDSIFGISWSVVVFSGMDFGPDGDLYCAGWYTNNVVRLDPATGADKGVFIADYRGLIHPEGMTWGPDGNLYISDGGTHTIARFDATGAPLPAPGKTGFEFASGGGLNTPCGLTFGPDGNLYVASGMTDQILRYDGMTGAFIDVFAKTDTIAMAVPVDVKFGPDGDLYVACMAGPGWGPDHGYVLRYNGTTGAFDRLFADSKGAYGLAFGPNGNLFVSGYWNHAIKQYNGLTGAYVSDFTVDPEDGSFPHYIAFGPVQSEPDAVALIDAKKSVDGTRVNVTAYVSAKFGDRFYIETSDRTSGIRVEASDSGLALGQQVKVVGTITTNSNGERAIHGPTVTSLPGTFDITPLGMNNRTIGGGDDSYIPGPPKSGQQGVIGGTGVNNIGLLVKTFGNVTLLSATSFTIDDGSGVSVTVSCPSGAAPASGYYAVTGVSSCMSTGSGLERVIEVSSAGDIQPF
ncbi:MAG: Vgb family protein [Armatimonadota bacterium]